jgi:hypothetical protein
MTAWAGKLRALANHLSSLALAPQRGRLGKAEGRPGFRRLVRDDTVALRPRRGGLAVLGQRGTLFVTQEGDPEDHVLGPGDRFIAAPRGLVAIWALSDAAVAISPPGGTAGEPLR